MPENEVQACTSFIGMTLNLTLIATSGILTFVLLNRFAGIFMSITRLSSKGQVIIPKSVRVAQQWPVGTELIVIETADGVLLRPSIGLPESSLASVAGCLQSHLKQSKPLSLADMDSAIAAAFRSQAHDRD